MTSEPFSLVGSVLDSKYRVDSVVQESSLSVVYRGTHLLWRRPVAIKTFKPADLPEEAHAARLEAFIREGALLSELSERCPSICQARDVGTFTTESGDWIPYLVLEWLEGNSLDEELESERLMGEAPRTLRKAAELLEPIARALETAHQKGISHLDFKPSNLFCVKDAQGVTQDMKLLDFGIARVASHAGHAEGQLLSFTPAYGAPEQFDPSLGAQGPWTDVFALALVLVEMITGAEPLDGCDPVTLGKNACDPTIRPSPRARGAEVTDAIEEVFLRALAVDPRRRYRTAGSFWRALELALDEHERAPAAPTPKKRRRGVAKLALVAAAIAGLGVAATSPAGAKALRHAADLGMSSWR